ncbi:DNA cytosine methyltransferase [Deinococcus sp. MIMF12]|uniref:Cytosine-specific methyltransferase n=1 Tax=Deinococcus rhizophilus TaxID=3049544 RepID=A0ABT7JFR5_9DEIO|nr:DNA cytosine methyltransferase [Deinococcus rhizophilus]MDL2343899.1 DNA cytosine methyltransferase [Deinococcus rhizophilus]
MTPYTVLSLFTGAGGLDLGFEREGFRHLEGVELNAWAVRTVRHNRPGWNVREADVREYVPDLTERPDVLLAGFPCQGFSLGGNRAEHDERNTLYREVIRVARRVRPRIIVIENVLNLRTMTTPDTGRPFALQIAAELEDAGYSVVFDVFRVSGFGVPQTRRRFIFLAFLGGAPTGFHLPQPGKAATIRPFVYDLAQGQSGENLPNHDPLWGFQSAVHRETGEPFGADAEVVPVRFSRTASDGHPVRSFDEPFPAVDTATVWGWAQGNVRAARHAKDRRTEKFIRNPGADVALWRVSASRLRTFTHREYARLQTFPDDWAFLGQNRRDVQMQIGNAVPVEFARRVARNVRQALGDLDAGRAFVDAEAAMVSLF